MSAAAPPAIDVTGVRTSPAGEVLLIEVEARAGGTRLAFGQALPSPIPDASLHGISIDGAPLALVLLGAARGALILDRGRACPPLPPVHALPSFSEAAVSAALAPLLPCCADGLYSITRAILSPAETAGPGLIAPRKGPVVLDPGPLAGDDGLPVVADLADGWHLLLGGRAALARGEGALVLSAAFVVEAAGFVARRHDRSAREAFARSPRHLFEDAALRDAIAAHRAAWPDADLGPLTEAHIEPAIALARALGAELACEDGLDLMSAPTRVAAGTATEFHFDVRVQGAIFQVVLRSDDGRSLGEAIVRSGLRYRATGLRPTARMLGRTLRQLGREEGLP